MSTHNVGTPFWKSGGVVKAQSLSSWNEFAGISIRHNELQTPGPIRLQTRGVALSLVQGPVEIGDAVGRSTGNDFFKKNGSPVVGSARASISDGSTKLIPVMLGAGGGGVATSQFPFKIYNSPPPAKVLNTTNNEYEYPNIVVDGQQNAYKEGEEWTWFRVRCGRVGLQVIGGTDGSLDSDQDKDPENAPEPAFSTAIDFQVPVALVNRGTIEVPREVLAALELCYVWIDCSDEEVSSNWIIGHGTEEEARVEQDQGVGEAAEWWDGRYILVGTIDCRNVNESSQAIIRQLRRGDIPMAPQCIAGEVVPWPV